MNWFRPERQSQKPATPKLSFEFFPPEKPGSGDAFSQSLARLSRLSPEFVSVTYGAGGSGRARSLAAIDHAQTHCASPVTAHLTASRASKAETDAVLGEFAKRGVKRILALRGDPEGGVGTPYVPHRQGYENAADLIAGVRMIERKLACRFDIAVAAYPEKHPESANWYVDIDMLKAKQNNGADRAITQFFFDNDVFEAYVARARKAGVTLPIIAGILPVHNFARVKKFSKSCGASIPSWLKTRFAGIEDGSETGRMIAAAIAAEQIADLTRRGVSDFHIYTMNQADLTLAIARLLGIEDDHDGDNIAA